MRRLLPPLLALTFTLGATACQGPKKEAPVGINRPPLPGAAPAGPPRPGALGTPPPLLAGPTRPVAQAGEAVTLTGKVKLISDKGGAAVSNLGGGILSNNGSGITNNHGAGVLSLAKLGLLQAAPPQEAALADATVQLVDAAGRVLTDEAGKPLAATSDAQGTYALRAVLPDENLVLVAPLWNGGELRAIVAREPSRQREVALDTAATLGATYVLTQFVKGDPAIYAKLAASEAARLRADLGAASALITTAPSYQAADMVALTERLRAGAKAVDETLTAIKALLLGQFNLGSGRLATEVPLTEPKALLRLADGSLLVSEVRIGRVRRIAPDGTITTWLDKLQGEHVKANVFDLSDMQLAPDGSVLVVDGRSYKVRRIAPDGTLTDVFGNGQDGAAPLAGGALEVAFDPFAIALGPDGTLYVGEDRHDGPRAPRVAALRPDGRVETLPAGPAEGWEQAGIVSLAVAPDGALWVLTRRSELPDGLWRLPKDGTAWRLVSRDMALDKEASMILDAEGRAIVAENEGARVTRFAPNGEKRVLAGRGGPAGTDVFAAPGGLLLAPDGTLYVTDGGAGRVWALSPAGALTRVAGTREAAAAAGASAIAVNAPGGLAFDAQGRLVFAEAGSHTVRRWDGQAVEAVVGTARGDGGDGGPALAGSLDSPTGIAIDRSGALWVLDTGNNRLRRVDPDGTLRTIAGRPGSQAPVPAGLGLEPTGYAVDRSTDLALDPGGQPVWTMFKAHQVHRLRPDGKVELVAGKAAAPQADMRLTGSDGGDGGKPTEAGLDTPLGVTYGPDGALYVSDTGNMRIRRIAPDGRTIETFAGQPRAATIAAFRDGIPTDTTPVDRRAATFFMPADVCFAPDGTMFVAELGNATLPLLMGLTEGLAGLATEPVPAIAARVRKIAPDGRVTTVAGPGGQFFKDPNAGDALVMPTGIAIDPKGRLVIVDGGANLIRFLPAGSF